LKSKCTIRLKFSFEVTVTILNNNSSRVRCIPGCSCRVISCYRTWCKEVRLALALGLAISIGDIIYYFIGRYTKQPFLVVIPALTLGNATLTFLITTFGNTLPF